MVKVDLDSPRQELSNGGLGIVVALLVSSGIDLFVCSYWKNKPAVMHQFALALHLPMA